jgi:hypothetical protein
VLISYGQCAGGPADIHAKKVFQCGSLREKPGEQLARHETAVQRVIVGVRILSETHALEQVGRGRNWPCSGPGFLAPETAGELFKTEVEESAGAVSQKKWPPWPARKSRENMAKTPGAGITGPILQECFSFFGGNR